MVIFIDKFISKNSEDINHDMPDSIRSIPNHDQEKKEDIIDFSKFEIPSRSFFVIRIELISKIYPKINKRDYLQALEDTDFLSKTVLICIN